jgi:hypothetical protein
MDELFTEPTIGLVPPSRTLYRCSLRRNSTHKPARIAQSARRAQQ